MDYVHTKTEAIKYLFIFYGYVPSILLAHAAYRRVRRHESRPLHERKVINCPYCSEPLTDIDKDAKVELYRYPARKQVRCQVYPVCTKCKNEVGMILLAQ
jgi:uncharacterized protein with PIN domain